MREIGKFINTTKRGDVDPTGSTIDSIYAEAVLANAPTTVVSEKGLLMEKEVEGQADSATFPVFDNFDLTWTNISGTGSDLGSEVTATTGGTPKFRKVTPVQESAALFVTDAVDLLVNKSDFELYAQMGGRQVSKRIDVEGISNGILAAETMAGSKVYVAGGFAENGSVSAGSTLTPGDLSEAKTLLETGSNIYPPNVVLMHRTQYNQLTASQDLSPTATTGYYRKATFDNSGNLTAYDGMEVVVTELVPAGTSGYYPVAGHPVAVFTKGMSGAHAKKTAGFAVHTQDERLRHGQYKIFDIMQKAEVLVPESIVILRAAD